MEVMKKGGCIVMTIDGPKGPREVVGIGTIKLAQQMGAPIVIYGLSAHAKRLDTWDRLLWPRPFARGASRDPRADPDIQEHGLGRAPPARRRCADAPQRSALTNSAALRPTPCQLADPADRQPASSLPAHMQSSDEPEPVMEQRGT